MLEVAQVSPLRPGGHAVTLLWTLIGFNPIYEAVCGAIEVVAAILLFFRRTALAGAILTGGGRPMTDLFIEPNGRAGLRDDAGELWRAGVSINDKDSSLALYRDGEAPLVYSFHQPDPMHLILKPSGNDAGALYLERVRLPDRYPLFDRGFHLVNEWPLER
jgi:hypothetical protein